MDNNLQTMTDEMDNIVSSFDSDDTDAFMQLSGQGKAPKVSQGLSRININYDVETEDGKTLTRGDWKMMYEGEMIYAKTVILRPILRTFEWSVFDPDQNSFSCKSVQKPSLSGDFPDTEGGNKCGRLSAEDEEKLRDDDPTKLRSRSAVCNQVLYSVISGDFKRGNGEAVRVDNHPVVAYFKRSGFVPIRNFIDSLTKQKKIMQKCNISLGTAKQKKGSVQYWIPVPTLDSETTISEEDKALMKKFADTVKAHNQNVLEQSRESVKLVNNTDEDSLADDFNAVAV
jgi:hypothetical protein